jgi:hypothetical protein
MGGNDPYTRLAGYSAEPGFGQRFPRQLFSSRPVFLLFGVYKENSGFVGVWFQRNAVSAKGLPQEFELCAIFFEIF